MPKKTASFATGHHNTPEALALAYGAFVQAGWQPKYATADVLTGFTKVSWGAPHETITIQADGGSLTATSQLPDGASWDILQKNKKNLAKFSAAWAAVAGTDAATLRHWQTAVAALQQSTQTEIAQQTEEASRVAEVMNLGTGTNTITYLLMGLNLMVFIAMVISGVSAFSPTNLELVNWGGGFKYYTVEEGQWWRLLTSTFLHAGLVHLLFNMYALFMIGSYLEPMLGKLRYTVAYLCAGIFASLTSLFYHGDGVVSVGASGAVFGVFGVFLALLTTQLIPKAVRQQLLQSIGIFVGFNLIYGLKGGIDNSAHLGGLIAGVAIGYLYYISLKNPESKKGNTMAAIVVAATAAVLCAVIFRS